MKTIYIAGCWDYCHQGHINILQKARNMGDLLIVAVNSDKFILSYKGIKMHYNENERVNAIRKLGLADVVFILEDYDSQRKYIDVFKPSIIVHGNDWHGKSLYKQMNITEEQIEKYGIEFKYPDYTPGVSSTLLREKNSKMKIAICFSGGLRTFKLCRKHIINLFRQIGEVDLFISTWEKPCYTEVKKNKDIHAINGKSVFKNLLGEKEIITEDYLKSLEDFKVIDIEPMTKMTEIMEPVSKLPWEIMSPTRLVCQYYKNFRCNNLKNEYAKKNNIHYDLIVRIRCDIKISSIPQKFDVNKIYLNSMVYAKNPSFKHKMINEMIYIANTENMNKICELYNDFNQVWSSNGFGEGVSYKYFLLKEFIPLCELHDFKIIVNRANGKIEKM